MGVLLGSQPGLPALAFGSVIEKARASLPWLPHMTATWASLQTRSTHMTLSGTLGSALCTARTGNSLDDLHNFRCFSSPPVSVNSFFLIWFWYHTAWAPMWVEWSFAGLFGGLKISASGLEDHTIQIAAKRYWIWWDCCWVLVLFFYQKILFVRWDILRLTHAQKYSDMLASLLYFFFLLNSTLFFTDRTTMTTSNSHGGRFGV